MPARAREGLLKNVEPGVREHILTNANLGPSPATSENLMWPSVSSRPCARIPSEFFIRRPTFFPLRARAPARAKLIKYQCPLLRRRP
jgi:hypothetical protein